jgi:hypothetical protein
MKTAKSFIVLHRLPYRYIRQVLVRPVLSKLGTVRYLRTSQEMFFNVPLWDILHSLQRLHPRRTRQRTPFYIYIYIYSAVGVWKWRLMVRGVEKEMMNTFEVGPEVALSCGHVRALLTPVAPALMNRLSMNLEMLGTGKIAGAVWTRDAHTLVPRRHMALQWSARSAAERTQRAGEAQPLVDRPLVDF